MIFSARIIRWYRRTRCIAPRTRRCRTKLSCLASCCNAGRIRSAPASKVLLYDLTSTFFESDLPDDGNDKRRHGYSRDKRSDCVQVVIALIATAGGFPRAHEALPSNTADNTTLRGLLQKIENQCGNGSASG
jgi:hypothetical protein